MNNLVFGTKKDVIAYLKSIDYLQESNDGSYFFESGTYYTAHGEYSRPDYKPRRYNDGWSIHVTYYYYPGTFNAPRDGRISHQDFFNSFIAN